MRAARRAASDIAKQTRLRPLREEPRLSDNRRTEENVSSQTRNDAFPAQNVFGKHLNSVQLNRTPQSRTPLVVAEIACKVFVRSPASREERGGGAARASLYGEVPCYDCIGSGRRKPPCPVIDHGPRSPRRSPRTPRACAARGCWRGAVGCGRGRVLRWYWGQPDPPREGIALWGRASGRCTWALLLGLAPDGPLGAHFRRRAGAVPARTA